MIKAAELDNLKHLKGSYVMASSTTRQGHIVRYLAVFGFLRALTPTHLIIETSPGRFMAAAVAEVIG